MSRRKRERESPDMVPFVGRVARAMVKRAAEGDLEALVALRAMQSAIDAATIDAARALHGHASTEYGGSAYSWTGIGRVLGISRQAARQAFGRQGSVVSDVAERETPLFDMQEDA
ncbi:hypothetical protein [Nocardioides sp.]|uniref:hypothetical protein n=1 Tax=Nocardioides sp. TaxID=35761 RepID=UPI0039E271C8